ncbi:MAG: Gfo/Idh/MocA family oxidoreductase [Kiritimatiellae bacterium]|nr:Gfo/Idh/MocA family oxidoreductase [Kiritimatiellia bacterium]
MPEHRIALESTGGASPRTRSRIKFGVCGIGRIGALHCRFFSRDRERYELVALCDLDPTRVNALKAEFGGKGYHDFSAFLADPEMELAIIATRSLDHARNAAQALAAGKTVLLEKPIGVTTEDCRLLRQLDQEYPGKLFFGHNHRFEPAFQNTCGIIASGLLGNIQVVKLCKHHQFMRRNDWQMRLDCGGGQLSVWGPHLLDQGLRLLGTPVREVWSYLRRVLTPGDADDHVKISLVGENGVVVELEISNSAALTSPYCAIYGDRGALTYEQDQQTIHLRYLAPQFRWPEAAAEAGTPVPGSAMSAEQELPWIEETRRVEPDTNMWEQVEIEIARHLFNALREGVPFPISNAEALEVVRITELVKEQNPQFNWKR